MPETHEPLTPSENPTILRFLMTETDGTWTEHEEITTDEYRALQRALYAFRRDEELREIWRNEVRKPRLLFGKYPEPNWSKPDPEIERTLRRDIHGELIERIARMRTFMMYRVAAFVEIACNDSGCTTPAEDFITSLVDRHAAYGVTPAEAVNLLQEFREDFEIMARDCRHFVSHYRPLVAGEGVADAR